MKSPRFLWFLLLCCLLISCGKISNSTKRTPDPTKPTKSGKDVIVFRVNEAFHIYEGKKTYFDGNGIYFSPVTSDSVSGLNIKASRTDYSDYLNIYVKVDAPVIGVAYKISSYSPSDRSYYWKDNENNTFLADSNHSSITFTRFDNTVVSGVFELTGKKDSLTEIRLTEGWFDISR